MSDDELSVGSPDDQLNESENTDKNLNSNTTNSNTTAALRILRKRKNSDEESNSITDSEKPLDFTNKKSTNESPLLPNPTVHHPNSYFLPYKKLEMSENPPSSPSSKVFIDQNLVKLQQDANSVSAPPGAKSVKKRGVAGFSIDDILSHKTAALKEQKSQIQQEQQQSIVRPWDISSATSGGVSNGSGSPHGGIPSTGSAHSGNGGAEKQRKLNSSKQQNQGDSSPLDALFQMASKTFEGLKAKSGKTFFFVTKDLAQSALQTPLR